MSTPRNSGSAGERLREFRTRIVHDVADMPRGQRMWLTMATGAGKGSALAEATQAFLARQPAATVIHLVDPLTATQQAGRLARVGFPVHLVRDDREMRNWLAHAERRRGLHLVAAHLSAWLPRIADGGRIDLLIVELGARPLEELDEAIGFGADRLLVVASTPFSPSMKQTRLRLGDLVTEYTLQDALGDTADQSEPLRHEVVNYHISAVERRLLRDLWVFFQQQDEETDRSGSLATASSRAAISSALFASQYRMVAPGVHRLWDRAGVHRADPDPISEQEPENIRRTAEIDDFLDRLDALSGDDKLAKIGSFVDQHRQYGQPVVLLAQNSATAEYVRQFLDTDPGGVDVEIAQKKNARTLAEENWPQVLVIADTDLGYLADVPRRSSHLWIDPPLSAAHAMRRLELADRRADLVAALAADPPLPDERESLTSWGFED